MSDLFEKEYGMAVHSKKLVQAYDAARAALTYARACTEEEIWRFAPDVVDTIEMEWIDDFDAHGLRLRRMSGPDFLMEDALEFEPEDVDFGRRWDAINDLVEDLAASWHDADSNYPKTEVGHFMLDRPRFTE
jgi:hypothetical protein